MDMKIHYVVRYINCLLFMALAGIVILSCSDDEIAGKGKYAVKEGVPVTVSLKLGVAESEKVSRAAASESEEQYVQNLFLIAFLSNGEISGKMWIPDVNEGGGAGTIENFPMKSGAGQTIYAIANVDLGYSGVSQTLSSFNDTHDEFLGLTATLRNKTNVDRGIFMMSGQLQNDYGESSVTVDTDGKFLDIANDAVIPLNRLEARITFNIRVDQSTWKDLKFVPKYYQVEQIPIGSYLIPREKGTGGTNTWDYCNAGYASMSERNQEKTDITELHNDENDYRFEFYVWENRFNPKQEIEEGDAERENAENLYALREKHEQGDDVSNPDKPGQEYEQGAFKYAHEHSTYVVIYGELTYKSTEGKTVTANVYYTIHLGSTGSEKVNGENWFNRPTLVNNYDTKRNTHYTYTITIAGVESMRVEVNEEQEEQRPGMEGDVIIATQNVELDSHYGRALFTLTRDQIMDGLSWSISTPFQRGIKRLLPEYFQDENKNVITDETQLADKAELKTYLNPSNSSYSSLNDYRWIQFVINREAKKDDSDDNPDIYFAKYPGYDAYQWEEGSDAKNPASAFGKEQYKYPTDVGCFGGEVKLYDVNQLLNHLYVEAHKKDSELFNEEGEVTITAFIDEFLYVYDPTEHYYRAPTYVHTDTNDDIADLKLWQTTVNGNPRTLSISNLNAAYSPDGNTSWTDTYITFSQAPIYTFYDPNAVATAWGTESIMETDRLVATEAPTNKSSNSMSNGRGNITDFVEDSNLKWSSVLNLLESQYGKLQEGYNNIWYACMGRNRDLNGDNVIDKDEIRWYLASIDQLTDLWIGEDALPDAAKLYDVNANVSGNTVQLRHVASSSLYARDNVWVIWAEEGASRGQHHSDIGETNKSCNYNGTYYDYRCVRNLGISLDHIDEEAEDYVRVSRGTNSDGDEEYYIDVSRLNNNTLRTGVTGNYHLPNHNEREALNRPSEKFAVLSEKDAEVALGIGKWTNDADDECPNGYRMPNQRELLLLSMYLGENYQEALAGTDVLEDGSVNDYSNLFLSHDNNNNTEYVSRTSYSFNGYYYQGLNANDNDITGNFNGRPGFDYAVPPSNRGSSMFRLFSEGDNYLPFYIRCVRDVTE